MTFESLDVRTKFIFSHPVFLEGIQVKFVYNGHRVKVKVREGTKAVDIPQCKTSISNNSGYKKIEP